MPILHLITNHSRTTTTVAAEALFRSTESLVADNFESLNHVRGQFRATESLVTANLGPLNHCQFRFTESLVTANYELLNHSSLPISSY